MPMTPTARYDVLLGWESPDIPRLVLSDPRAGVLPVLQTRIANTRRLAWLTGTLTETRAPALEAALNRPIALNPLTIAGDPDLQECLDAVGLGSVKAAIETLSRELPRLLSYALDRPSAAGIAVGHDADDRPLWVEMTGTGLPLRRLARPRPRSRAQVWI